MHMPPYLTARSDRTKGRFDKSVGKTYMVPIKGNGIGPGGKLQK